MPPPAEPAPPKLFGPPFSRRDFLTFGIGAGAGAAVTFLGCLVAVLGRRTPPPTPPAPPEGKEKETTTAPGARGRQPPDSSFYRRPGAELRGLTPPARR